MQTLPSIQKLNIADGSEICCGARQDWYEDEWKRRAGCGPTVCSTLLNYVSRTRERYKLLCPYDSASRAGFLLLMEDVWSYVTPGAFGVNETSILANGAERYARDRELPLACETLEVPRRRGARPAIETLMRFVVESIEIDLPVAFLNLNNGGQKDLDSWHWVTIVGTDAAQNRVQVFDDGKSLELNLAHWLKQTKLGGGVVRFILEENDA